MIAITDLTRQYAALEDQLLPAIEAVCRSGYFIKGPALQAFEQDFAAYLGVKYAVGVNSGTDALFLALKAAGVGPGDEVITTGMSFLATAEAISLTGAEPVFVDIAPGTDCLLSEAVAAAITPRTRALIPVHLHGYPCDMAPLLELAAQHDLRLIEDCAQSTGATWRGRQTGSIGDFGCFSFFPTKNLGCFGDGGLVCTQDEGLYRQLLMLREHGSARKNYQDILGVNSRLDTLQAAVLQVKLPYLDGWNARRRELAARYHTLLADVPVTRPALEAGPDTVSVFHHYALRVPGDRDALQAAMKERGYECMAYYPQALHLQTLYRERYPAGALPESEACARQTLALPLFPELTASEQDEIVAALSDLLRA
ncbi:MAG: DegT/DnrJ/EryC1/StrS family aminotransferase [Candidatus Sericytochromatia bacterium]